jgi:hypothetical protein
MPGSARCDGYPDCKGSLDHWFDGVLYYIMMVKTHLLFDKIVAEKDFFTFLRRIKYYVLHTYGQLCKGGEDEHNCDYNQQQVKPLTLLWPAKQ